eukprot:1606213-Alexandrium_andersonii.AAC.1
MSASLVGSEMCIRDRPRGRRGSGASHPCGSKVAPDASPGGRRRPPRGPVSYTHLTLPTICSV